MTRMTTSKITMSRDSIMSKRVSPDAYGCWIDGHLGQYATSRLIEIAIAYGYDTGEYDRENLDDVVWVGEGAEDYLNEYVAPDGYSFGWFDGEFFLWSFEMWDDEYEGEE